VRSILALTAVAVIGVTACASDNNDAQGVPSPPSVTFATTPTSIAPPVTTTQPVTGTATATTVGSTTPLALTPVAFTPVADGLAQPVDVAWRPDDPTFYVVQKTGQVVPVRDGAVGAPVLDIQPLVSDGSEQGLLGLAFHPTRPLAYVDYTNRDGDTVVAEYSLATDGTFVAASARQVLTIHQPYPNHNGGNVAFGPDGFLYIGMGDGGAAFDPERRALNTAELLGKILRIDPVQQGDRPYTVPADNPFRSVTGAKPEIWAVGVRNPWRFGFDSATGDLWIADVGQNKWEEVDVARRAAGGGRGVNFGWSAMEGTHPANTDQSPDGATPPVFEYPHGDDGCSISGGAVYRGSTVPSLVGHYVFSDYCSGKVRALPATPGATITVFDLGRVSVTSAVRAAPDGEVFVLSLDKGQLLQLTPG
jgi:glucose/arabinose dehydrogenase